MSTNLKIPFNIYTDKFVGLPDATIELVQYGDFQCNYCGEAYTAIKTIRRCLGNELRFIFRHFPLPSMHALSLEAAVASEAAALQGRFWEMHDIIFENQRYLVKSSFSQFADEIGLNLAMFQNTIGHKKLMHKVSQDIESALICGVYETPTFFINGLKYDGFDDFDSLYTSCKGTLHAKTLIS